MKNEQITSKFAKNVCKDIKINPKASEAFEKVVIKKFASRPRPQPHKCSLSILPRTLNHCDQKVRNKEISTSIVDVQNLTVKTPSWGKKASSFKDAWEESCKVSSVQDVAVKTPSAVVTSKGSITTQAAALSVENSSGNISQYTKQVSKYSFKSQFPIHKVALKSSSESIVNPQFLPKLVCDCPLSAQSTPDTQCLPRVIVKDSANFGKFRRDIVGTESAVINSSYLIALPDEGRAVSRTPTEALLKDETRRLQSNRRQLVKSRGPGKIETTNTSSRLNSVNSLTSLAVPSENEVHCLTFKTSNDIQHCSLNHGYVVKRIVYTVEDSSRNCLSRNRSRKPKVSPGT